MEREEGDPCWAVAHQGLPIRAQTPPPSLSLFDPGHPAHTCREQVSWVRPCCLPANEHGRSHPGSSPLQHRSPTELLEPLRHAPLGGICREAGELNGVINSSAYYPPSSPCPNACMRGQQGEAHASGSPATSSGVVQGTAAGHAGSSCPARQAGWESKSQRKILWQGEKAQPQHTHKLRSQPSEQKRVSMPRARLFSSLFPARSSELTGSAFIPPRRAAHGSRAGGGKREAQMKSRPRKQFLFPPSPPSPPQLLLEPPSV